MVGFLQIMIYLLSVYLVYKGFEIFQIAYTSKPDNPQSRKVGIVLGVLAIVGAVVVSVIAIGMTEMQAQSMQDNFKNLGR